jgi:hypothetical protein
MPVTRFQSRQSADAPASSCRRHIHPPTRRHHQIPIAPAAPPVPNFPRLRALALFGRRPPQRVDGSSCRRPKTCTEADSCSAAKKKCHSFTCLNNGNAQRRQPHRWRLSTREQRWRHGEAERLRSLETDRKRELGRLFDRDVGCKNAWCILQCWLFIKALEEKCRR